MLVALGLVMLGLFLATVEGSDVNVPLVGSLVVGLIAAGWSVATRLRTGFANLEARLDSACIVAGAALVSGIAWIALAHKNQALAVVQGQWDSNQWDSMQLLVAVGVWIAVFGAILILLPWALRKWVISFCILFHFGAILTAATTVPAGSTGSFPWISSLLWMRVFRYHLLFCYMNNAYHFYSPDPGPPTLVWFLVEYDDKGDSKQNTKRWVQLARRSDFATRLEYQRFLAVTESTNQINSNTPFNFQQLVEARDAAGLGFEYEPPIPPSRLLPFSLQYREPQEFSKRMLESYVRHVVRAPEYRHPEKPETPIKSVRVYRVVHTILEAPEMARGGDPVHPTVYHAYYQGEFDSEGKLLRPDDPFLYWLLPVYYAPKGFKPRLGIWVGPNPGEYELYDCLSIHAGDSNWNPYRKK
jgi:hypothetical protein